MEMEARLREELQSKEAEISRLMEELRRCQESVKERAGQVSDYLAAIATSPCWQHQHQAFNISSYCGYHFILIGTTKA